MNAEPQEPIIWSVDDLAEKLGKSASWVYAHRREIPSFKLPGGGIAFAPGDILAWLESLKKKPATLFALRDK